MDRTEKPKRRSGFANGGEVNETNAPALASSTGHAVSSPVGARPRSEVTGRHDAGSGANQTADGLNSSEVAMRRGAEEVPIGAPESELRGRLRVRST